MKRYWKEPVGIAIEDEDGILRKFSPSVKKVILADGDAGEIRIKYELVWNLDPSPTSCKTCGGKGRIYPPGTVCPVCDGSGVEPREDKP